MARCTQTRPVRVPLQHRPPLDCVSTSCHDTSPPLEARVQLDVLYRRRFCMHGSRLGPDQHGPRKISQQRCIVSHARLFSSRLGTVLFWHCRLGTRPRLWLRSLSARWTSRAPRCGLLGILCWTGVACKLRRPSADRPLQTVLLKWLDRCTLLIWAPSSAALYPRPFSSTTHASLATRTPGALHRSTVCLPPPPPPSPQ